MVRGFGFLAVPVMVMGVLLASNAWAQQTAVPADTQFKCAFDEYQSTDNGVTVCKKVPTCAKDEVNSYDTTMQKFVCKKLVICDPRTQQAAYINGKNVCIDVPNCEKAGMHYAFDGTKMVCQ
jgi:hypothetical protein